MAKMRVSLSSVLLFCGSAAATNAGGTSSNTRFQPVETVLREDAGGGGWLQPDGMPKSKKMTARSNRTRFEMDPNAPTPEEREAERQARILRHRERNARAKETLHRMGPGRNAEMVPEEKLSPNLRRELWGNKQSSSVQFANPGDDYDMWQQAYRMLGGFIDCDHHKDEDGSHDNEDRDGDGGQQGCSRWMLWAAYVDPNYQGNGYYEYFGDEPTGVLDCHNPDTEWVLLGVYREEFYQYIEQISKHLWAIDEYEYVVALAGLAYMTDYDCWQVGYTNDGDTIYAGVEPLEYGEYRMALYTDSLCLTPNNDLGMTFDDFGLYSDVKLSSQDNGGDDGYSYAYEWWEDTQEYTLTQLNEVYSTFKYCTSCIDYPTYQDGYFIGDDGTDEDDLINQCWKFYSHDSFTCEADCVALAHSQGTILSVVMGDKMYGQALDSFYEDEETLAAQQATAKEEKEESKLSRLLANVFVTFSFIVFIATFLAFAVARRSRYRESRSSKSRRLLDDDDKSPTKRSTRSKSKSRSNRDRDRDRDREEEGDGIFRSSSRKSRSKSKSKSKSSRKSRSKSKGQESGNDGDYEPPRRSSSSKRRSSSNNQSRQVDDF